MFRLYFFLVTAAAVIYAAAVPTDLTRRHALEPRTNPYTIPSGVDLLRSTGITTKRAAFLYGQDPAGTNISFPSGVLGAARAAADFAGLEVDATLHLVGLEADQFAATAAIALAGGINSLSDYSLLYKGQWKTVIGDLSVPGMLENYTQDSMFSMERLSTSPYSIRRLNPTKDSLPFTVDDALVTNLTGVGLGNLFSTGRLFYVDYSSLQKFTPVTGRYGAACEAFFYIDPTSGDFLPLAVKTNVGNDLVYTPLDEPTDWLLAKMMFNENDLWFTAWYHFASTHYVAGLSLTAAIRCMSDDHPVLAILNRVNLQAYSFQQIAEILLFSPGTFIDQYFVFPGSDARQSTQDYYAAGAGAFQSNYFHTQFTTRGLINSTYGPPLKNSPFVEDAEAIHAEIQTFMSTFVNSYYKSSAAALGDVELQCWAKEAGPAKLIDFPSAISDTQTLVDMLTHIAFLVTVQHHTLNTNDLVTTFGLLPFHPSALYSPIPTAKGVKNILPYLPPASQAVGQVGLLAQFSRPEFERTSKSLTHMFDDAIMLSRLNSATVAAAGKFKSALEAFSQVVSSRTFDSQGLSRGMPFLWRALDPQVIPYYAAI